MTLLAAGEDGSLLSAVTSVAVIGAVYAMTRSRTRRRIAAALPLPAVEPNHPVILPHPTPLPEADTPVKLPVPIDHVRVLLGPPRRTFDKSLKPYLTVEPPAWLKRRKKDEHWLAVKNQARLREMGTVVWAAVVQANSLLFKPGAIETGASVIYSFDPQYDAHPDQLQQIAQDLFELKGTDQADPATATFARMLTLESARGVGLKVPHRFTGGRDVLHAAVLLPRKHLPRGYLTGNILPVWVDPAGTGAVLPIPAAYWPPSLLRYWQPRSSTPQPKDEEA